MQQLRLPHMLIIALALLVAVFPLTSAFAQMSDHDSDSVHYTFTPGDTLIGLAQKYFQRPQDYRIVQRLNAIANPKRIAIGTVVAIPTGLLKYRPESVQIIAFRGTARISEAGRGARAPAVNESIGEGFGLATGAASSLSLAVSDGSILTMPSNSVVRIVRLRRLLLTDSLDFAYALDDGAMRSKVAPARNANDRFQVRTPSAVSAVRGTDFRTRYDNTAGRSFAELVEGGLDVAANTGEQANLKPGFGATVGADGLNTEALLPAPEITAGSGTQRDPQLNFAVAPSAEASGYRLQIARDSSFIDLVEDVASTDGTFTLDQLDDGSYFAKFTISSQSGLEGLPANIAFRRRLNSLSGSAGKGDAGFTFRWIALGSGERRYRLQIFRGDDPEAAPMVDEAGLTESALTLTDLPPGEYRWRIGTTVFYEDETEQVWTDFETIRLAAD